MLTIDTEFDTEARVWVAEVLELPGVIESHEDKAEAIRLAQALAMRVLADRLEHGEPLPAGLFAAA